MRENVGTVFRSANEASHSPDHNLVFMTIEHGSLAETVRVVNDVADFVWQGNRYYGAPFSGSLLSDDDKQPRAEIRFANVSDELAAAIRKARKTPILSMSVLLRSNFYDTRRLTYLPDGAFEERTNYFKYSQEIDNAAWTKSLCSITPNATTAPDGTVTAGRWTEDTSNNQHLAFQNAFTDLEVGEKITMSAYFKGGLGRDITFTSFGQGFTAFNTTTGAVIAVGGTNVSSVETLANGWFRGIVTITKVNTNGNCYIGGWNAGGGNNSYLGNGTSGFYLWGAQVERGDQASPYMVSTDSNPTHAADYAAKFLRVKHVTVDPMEISAELGSWDYTAEPWPNVRATRDRLPGLFRRV